METEPRERRRAEAWRLECVDGAGPCELRPAAGALRVGRAVQAAELWERLLPDGAARASVSREHFEVEARAGAALLRNLSARGTLVNGAAVHGEVALSAGDVVAIGLLTSEYGSRPALHFRFAVDARGSPSGAGRAPATLPAGRGCSIGKAVEVSLEWLGSAGPPETLAHPVVLPVSDVVGHAKVLRVGRAIQPLTLWEAVVPDGALRSAVSREHFEVRLQLEEADCGGKRGAAITLVNLSSAGTLLNGVLVQDKIQAEVGDLVALPRPREAGEGGPIARFRLSAAAPAWARASPGAPGPGPGGPGPAELAAVATPLRGGPGPRADVAPAPVATPAAAAAAVAAGTGAAGLGPALPGPAAPGPAAVVRVSAACLPPPFALECLSSLGLAPGLVAGLPWPQRVLEASCSRASLRVGRAVQCPDFWSALLPDEALRNTVSREHFEILLEDGGLLLLNFSASGTLVNNKCIDDRVRVLPGDRIGLGGLPGAPAAVWFALSAACADGGPEGAAGAELGGARGPGSGPGAPAPAAEPPRDAPGDALGGTMPPVPSEGLASAPLARELPRMLPAGARPPQAQDSRAPRAPCSPREGGGRGAPGEAPRAARAPAAQQPAPPRRAQAGQLAPPRHGR